jgi:conjugal transfer pilus assembly protein TrbC
MKTLSLLGTIAVAVSVSVLMLPRCGEAQTVRSGSATPAPPSTSAVRAPTAGELETARRQLPQAEDIGRAVREQERLRAGVVPRLPAQPAAAAPDLSRLAEQYERLRAGPGASEAQRQASGLLVFVSLGMPKASLDRLLDDASRTGATLVLRGVRESSVTRTAAIIAELMGPRRVSWQIDPQLFSRFDVRVVPAYVLVDLSRPVQVSCGESQCQREAFAKVAGDVSLLHALATIGQAEPDLASLARRIAAPLRVGTRPGARE